TATTNLSPYTKLFRSHIVTVETLDYLYKGGRLSKLSYVVGGGLNIKPMIEIDENGSLVAYAKVRGRKKAVNKIIEEIGKRGKDRSEEHTSELQSRFDL